MKTSTEGFQQCYNAQIAVDGEHQLIVATEVSAEASDQGQMMGLLEEVEGRVEGRRAGLRPNFIRNQQGTIRIRC